MRIDVYIPGQGRRDWSNVGCLNSYRVDSNSVAMPTFIFLFFIFFK